MSFSYYIYYSLIIKIMKKILRNRVYFIYFTKICHFSQKNRYFQKPLLSCPRRFPEYQLNFTILRSKRLD